MILLREAQEGGHVISSGQRTLMHTTIGKIPYFTGTVYCRRYVSYRGGTKRHDKDRKIFVLCRSQYFTSPRTQAANMCRQAAKP